MCIRDRPGIYSARWAGYEGVDTKMKDLANINKVLEELKDVPKGERGAQFKAVVAFCRKNLDSSYLEKDELGVLPGEILTQPIGSSGFGYDPIFLPDQFEQSLAQLPPVLYVTVYVLAANVADPKLPVAVLLIPAPLHVPPADAETNVTGKSD